MHQLEMIHWLWIWRAWEKVKYGLMVKASVDIGLPTKLLVLVEAVTIGEHIMRKNVKAIAGSPLKDGIMSLDLG
ncbi:hypothetical protein J5N97_006380 [Dioscorea zingiberensis]|uniref:Uncharacterized protein n=1 Tax=Dioscorea zingiberensis TaxID=325984 RepID=A0A9D5HTA0_9LILI|nr:hypothetical protein J5N97_006380 [Dioscorea zingiberensis]